MTVKRPLVWVSVALVGGAAFSSFFAPPFTPFLWAFLLSFLLGVLLIILRKRVPAAAAVLAAAFFLGICAYLLKAYTLEIPDQLAQHYASDTTVTAGLRGVVRESRVARDGRRVAFILDVDGIDTRS